MLKLPLAHGLWWVAPEERQSDPGKIHTYSNDLSHLLKCDMLYIIKVDIEKLFVNRIFACVSFSANHTNPSICHLLPHLRGQGTWENGAAFTLNISPEM